MKNGKKTIIITLILIFVLITILVIYLSSKAENNPNKNNINGVNNEKIFKKVDDYDEFFSVQNTLNDGNELNTSFVIQELYLNRISNTKYYFIKCSKLKSDIGAETIDYDKNIYYILIANNNQYKLSEINGHINDLENYAKNYQVQDITINSGSTLKRGYTSEETILTIYIEYFKDMLILDTELAYNMLSEETKENYTSYTDFYNQVINIYNKLSSKVFAYNKKEQDENNIYYIEDDNRNKIVITESGIMDFKISY